MTLDILCAPVPGSRHTCSIKLLRDNENISGQVGADLYRLWKDEQPLDKRHGLLRNQRFELNNGLVWRLFQPNDNAPQTLEIILENDNKVEILRETLKRTGLDEEEAFETMQNTLHALIASRPKNSPESSPSTTARG